MLEEGLVEEVQALRSRGDLNHQLPSIKSVGYRQVWQYLDGEIDYDAMVEKSIIATRQLAKRQLTWLRSWPSLQSLRDSSTQSVHHVLKYMDATSI
jgi:tRNA dimethylallyltransferase